MDDAYLSIKHAPNIPTQQLKGQSRFARPPSLFFQDFMPDTKKQASCCLDWVETSVTILNTAHSFPGTGYK